MEINLASVGVNPKLLGAEKVIAIIEIGDDDYNYHCGDDNHFYFDLHETPQPAPIPTLEQFTIELQLEQLEGDSLGDTRLRYFATLPVIVPVMVDAYYNDDLIYNDEDRDPRMVIDEDEECVFVGEEKLSSPSLAGATGVELTAVGDVESFFDTRKLNAPTKLETYQTDDEWTTRKKLNCPVFGRLTAKTEMF